MKKIIMVLVIFISSIIFYDSYVNLSQKQYSDVIFCERKEWIGIEERSSA